MSFDYKKYRKITMTPTGKGVLEKRYLIKDESGEPIESAEDLLWRVAGDIALAEKNWHEEDYEDLRVQFYKMMADLEFLPNSPTLMNAGRKLQQLSACFVLPVEDSMDKIFEAIKQTAIIHKTGGGTGFSFSKLRPSNSPVASTGGVASGPVSFMKVFNSATDVVKQGGTRRGANMGILRVDHPDIEAFIRCKEDCESLTNFNISVALTDRFMEALEKDTYYDLVTPLTGEVVSKRKASDIFKLIVDMAWNNGEPGIIFIDRINKYNPTPDLGEIESTNPCGEQPLLPYESCNLGSINLSKMLTAEGIDWDRLERTTKLAVRFLDDVIERNHYPIEDIERISKANRKIGLGVMGFADLLFAMGVAYNSDEALEIADKLSSFIKKHATAASQELAKERGAFPNFKYSVYYKNGLPEQRNATVTTIAPTGSISILAGCSSGIEPLFALTYIREILDGVRIVEVNPLFEKAMKECGLYSEKLMQDVAKNGTISNMLQIPSNIRDTFVVSHDISPEAHIKMQAAFQKNIDNAVSKTVNFPNRATKKNVETAFILAYKEGCKGVTVYRDGSRDSQVLNLTPKQEYKGNIPRPRPDVTVGRTEKVAIGCGNIYVTVNSDDINMCEVFTQTGKGGGCPSQSEAVGRLVSMALRSNIDPACIINQLRGIRCVSCTRRDNVKVLSCPDAIARVMEKALKEIDGRGIDRLEEEMEEPRYAAKCPECDAPLEMEGGCNICRSCGYSRCG